MAIGRINATLTGVQPGGLAKIVPTSVAVGSGSGSVDANGNVTFSGASSISLNSCFTSSFENYRIVMNITSQSASQPIRIRVRASGSDLSTSTYRWGLSKCDYTTTTVGDGAQGVTSALWGYTSTANGRGSVDIFNPQTANNTVGVMQWAHSGSTWAGGFYVDNTTSYDGFTILPDSGTITGTLRVYGYNQ